MKNEIPSFRTLNIILAIVITAFFSVSCKQKHVAEYAVATFIVGNVTIERPGEGARKVNYKDELRKGDVISTGPGSLFAFQLGEKSVIKIQENSTLKMNAVFENGRNSLHLENGKVFTTVKKLDKVDSVSISTRTSLAAVRGTDFSVAYDQGKSVVAVNEGTVKVRAVEEGENIEEVEKEIVAEPEVKPEEKKEKKVKKEVKEIRAGNTAVVKVSVETRPLTEDEKEEFRKNEKIEVIVNVEKKTEKELKKIQVKIIEGKDETAEDEKDDEAKLDEDTEEAKDEEQAEEETPAGNAVVTTSKKVFQAGENIVIYYNNFPKNDTCWISVAKAGAKGSNFIYYEWTYGKPQGQMVFRDLGLEPGAYEIRGHFSRSHDVSRRTTISVAQ